MSSKRGHKSEHKHSRNADVWGTSSSQQQSRPGPSFLFAVNELRVNEDPNRGGLAPRVNDNGRWLPPINPNGFDGQDPGNLYRWENGNVNSAQGPNDCIWYDRVWFSRNGTPLTPYKTTTIFWCNPWAQFMTATGDASTRDFEEESCSHPDNRWWPLTFRHDGALSRVEEGGEEQRLAGAAGPTARWISDLGLDSYAGYPGSQAGGLAGSLPIIIALVAFSCGGNAQDLSDILLNRRAWRNYQWHGHYRQGGRIDGRGVVVTVYLDPENPWGSTNETLNNLEWSGGVLLG